MCRDTEKALHDKVTEKRTLFEEAKNLDDYLKEEGLIISKKPFITMCPILWQQMYSGALDQNEKDAHRYAYRFANNRVRELLDRAYAALGEHYEINTDAKTFMFNFDGKQIFEE